MAGPGDNTDRALYTDALIKNTKATLIMFIFIYTCILNQPC